MFKFSLYRVVLFFVGCLILNACASTPPDEKTLSARGRVKAPQWYALIGSGAYDLSGADRLGKYASRDKCQEALNKWLSSQLASTRVWGECITKAIIDD